MTIAGARSRAAGAQAAPAGLFEIVRRSRIRWSNVGRVAAGLAAVVGLIVLVPGLLVPREPESLPADVGLATGAGDTYAYVDPEPRGDRPAGEAGRRSPVRRG